MKFRSPECQRRSRIGSEFKDASCIKHLFFATVPFQRDVKVLGGLLEKHQLLLDEPYVRSKELPTRQEPNERGRSSSHVPSAYCNDLL